MKMPNLHFRNIVTIAKMEWEILNIHEDNSMKNFSVLIKQ